ncbi:sister chromatid cohesion protein Dcc1 [Fomitopsis serialis]|uniref:sister chromatid cohesion protein Dcc1 n=1 Tax=Fomitopsis serialis TaxID=139415 RepID=UPI002008EB12|nr:sister chromatid cohesion protein Dcc1 [Neoantrodia serialis]KAH9914022.1 sister chromatid cohesion protein Dcc1 [Neoantrodia serialis]
MPEYPLKLSSSAVVDTAAFKLLELPPDLCKLVESKPEEPSRYTSSSRFQYLISVQLVNRGDPDEDAVLCTADKTYTTRSIVLSISVTVATAGIGEDTSTDEPSYLTGTKVRDQLNEILELVPSVPRLHKLDVLLRGKEYDEGQEGDDDMYMDEFEVGKRKFTYEEAMATLQASDIELDQGLKKRRVLILNGELRPISPTYLNAILELLLTHLVSLSLSHDSASIDALCSALHDGYDVRKDVCKQVMAWFGDIINGEWCMDKTAVVRGIGLGMLGPYREESIPLDEFLTKWRKSVGDTFESEMSVDLLCGKYLTQTDVLKEPPIVVLTYFPSFQLLIDSAARFTDHFLTRPRWKADEISPFLADIVVDAKERDKFLLKYARAITDAEGIWYTARAKYKG